MIGSTARFASASAFALLVTFGLAATCAQETFPSRPITVVVPFPPGGSADPLMRVIGQKLSESLKQSIVIDNKGGGGGNIAAKVVKQSAPDGYTLFMANMSTHAVNVALYSDLGFDPIKDFAPITLLMSFPSILVVPADSPAKTVADLAALAKTKPGGLSYASQGVGSGGHLLGEMFRAKLGVPMVHVPYRGAAPAVQDLIGGRVDLLFASYISAGPSVEAGKLRILGLTSTKRAAALPNVPTMAEAGYPGVELDLWYGIMAPAGTPAPVVKLLHDEFVKAANSPEVQKLVVPQAAEVVTSMPEEFAALVAADITRLGKVVRDAGAKAE
ncbi:MAG: Bug family tripartite tricarboxylate transporter substrate binding protein [Xanthobacteraceae bacterium]